MHISQRHICFISVAFALLSLFGMLSWPVAAAPAPAPDPNAPLSIKDALQWGSVSQMQISPDGKHIAALIQRRHGDDGGTVRGIIVYDTATLEPRMMKSDVVHMPNVRAIRWFNDRLLSLEMNGRSNGLSSLDGKEFISTGEDFITKIDPDSAGNERFLYMISETLYRYNIGTKEKTYVEKTSPERVLLRWLVDHQGEVRAMTTMNSALFSDDTTITHWYRNSSKQPWEKLASYAYLDDHWFPVAFSEDDQSLIVASRQGRDTNAYFRYDLKERKVREMLAGHPTQDVYADFYAKEGDAKYVLTTGLKTEIKWFNGKGDALQYGVDLALPDRINLLQGNPEKQVLVYSYSDRDPGRWFVLDVATGSLRFVASRKPEIDIDKMLPKQTIEYKARDGLTIPAYLTVPNGAGPKPAVIYIHGGPEARDGWDWDPEVQMLAARGYTVFQPQFRGSSGFGKRYIEAGYGQWGLAMQDDITDGVKWLVAQGHADPARICIYGASYGGYAAMWGLVKTPDLYRCGASFAGVSDLKYMLNDRSDVNATPTGRLYRNMMLNASAAGNQMLDDVSPLKNTARIKVPLLIAHGEWDKRVPLSHSEKMVSALKDSEKEFEWIELWKEGHGIYFEQNQQKFYQALFKFFDRHIGHPAPAPAPVPAPAS